MPDRSEILAFLHTLAPLSLAEEWDNVGLLLGSERGPISRLLTCLTLTPDVADEAISEGVGMIVSHHPILFRPVQSLTDSTSEGAMLLKLIAAGISVYSPHTAYDSAAEGINAQLAAAFGLENLRPIRPVDAERAAQSPELKGLGSGRLGELAKAIPLHQFAEQVADVLPCRAGVQLVGEPERPVRIVAVACGSAAEFLNDALRLGADLLLTGEARFHACLEARQLGIALIIAGHYATERPGVERLAEQIGAAFHDVSSFASRVETDPQRLWS